MEELLEKVEEITEETVEKPVEQPQLPVDESPAPTTAALEQELEELRREKLHRLLMDEASMLLQERGIDPSFASFVLAEDSAATRKKVEQFDRRLADTLRKHLTDRLPVGEPKDFRAAKIPQRRPEIRKVS